MTDKVKHIDLPLKVRRWDGDEWPEKRVSIADGEGHALFVNARYAELDESENHAQIIVTAANYHERLVEALRESLEVMERGYEYNISQAKQRIRLSKNVSELLNELDTKKD